MSSTVSALTKRNVSKTSEVTAANEQVIEKKKPAESSKVRQFIILIVIWTALVVCATYYFKWKRGDKTLKENFDITKLNVPYKISGGSHSEDYFVFSLKDLAHYDGTDPNLPLFIVVKGHVFDVSNGRSYYGPGSGYNFFAGRDGTRSFATGCFDATKEECTKNSHVY
jgi:predicted heme/steroid binding protein